MTDNVLDAMNCALESVDFYVLQISRRENGTQCRPRLWISCCEFAKCRTGYHCAGAAAAALTTKGDRHVPQMGYDVVGASIWDALAVWLLFSQWLIVPRCASSFCFPSENFYPV